jgi:hypothetical protein
MEKGYSTSTRTRHINVRYFFVKDRVKAGECHIQYLPTGDMVSDILTKPVHGADFIRKRDKLLGYTI